MNELNNKEDLTHYNEIIAEFNSINMPAKQREAIMTGREWYERFSAEIGKLSHISIDKDYQLDYSTTVKRMLEAARKASGIENE